MFNIADFKDKVTGIILEKKLNKIIINARNDGVAESQMFPLPGFIFYA